MKKETILIVDDEPACLDLYATTLEREGYDVAKAANGAEALRLVEEMDISAVVADIRMPGMDGIELLEKLKSRRPNVDVLVTTGFASVETAVAALKKGAFDYLKKPFEIKELVTLVENMLSRRRVVERNKALEAQLMLYEVCKSFGSEEDPDRVFRLGLDAVVNHMGCKGGVALRTEAGVQFMEVVHKLNVKGETARRVRQGLIEKGRSAFERPDETTMFAGRKARHILGEGGGLLVVPIPVRGVVAGAFVLLLEERERYQQRDTISGLEFIALQAGVAFEAAKRTKQARELAYLDALTGLNNSRYLPLALEAAKQEADADGEGFSILFIDLDGFRRVNSSYGHLAGGRVLVEVAGLLRSQVRFEDTLVRYGGDEFAVLLPDADREMGLMVAERIRDKIAGHAFLENEDKKVSITASIGVATYGEDGETVEELIHVADLAMYESKNGRGNSVKGADRQ